MIPAGITGAELDRSVKAELRSLPRSLADLVAQHLVASGRVLDDDPELAYRHARTARRLAARIGGVREAVAITAYLAEHYDEALTELRAVRRMTGNHEVLAMMADCERALGRPEKALMLARDKHVRDLTEATQVELLIVAAGARRDMGQTAAAIQTLEVPELTKRTRAEWLPRLRYAYADALEAAGRTEEALVWFHRAAGVDAEGVTGAAERAARLEGLEFTDLGEDDEYDDQDDESYDANLEDEADEAELGGEADEAEEAEEAEFDDEPATADLEDEAATADVEDPEDDADDASLEDDADEAELEDEPAPADVEDAEDDEGAVEDGGPADVRGDVGEGSDAGAADGGSSSGLEGVVDDALDGEIVPPAKSED
ncbi:ICP22 family protein [Kribbella swartbergensis]